MRNGITRGHAGLIRSEIEFTCCGFNTAAQGEGTSELLVNNEDGTIPAATCIPSRHSLALLSSEIKWYLCAL